MLNVKGKLKKNYLCWQNTAKGNDITLKIIKDGY